MSATEATLKVISTTIKMILASEENTATTKMILTTEKVITASFKRCLIHYISDLSPSRSDHMIPNNDLSHYKGDLGYKQTDVSH